jgi:hypothetical protein
MGGADSKLHIEGGSRLSAESRIALTSGTLMTLAGGTSNTVVITVPTLVNTGADVVINGPTPANGPHTAGELHCIGDVAWSGGTYRPVVDAGNNTTDLWACSGTFTVQQGAKIAPGTINIPAGGIAKGATFGPILEGGDGGIVGAPPAVDSPLVTYDILTNNPVTQWILRKT